MRAFTKSVTTSIALFVCAAGLVRGQVVNGNATIHSQDPVFGSPLTLSTSSQYAGAVSSINWGNKEFINNWDHGRQLQLNSQFFNRFICYNPYEAGGFNDGQATTSSSKLLSLTASGNHLDATTQMAWYYYPYIESDKPEDYCGDRSQWLTPPSYHPYTTPLSNYTVHKTITIGFAGIPNVIEYLVEQFVPEPVLKGMNNVTAVLNYEFSSLRSWDVVSKDYRNVRALAGADDRIKVVSTADGSHAMGWYNPEQLQPYDDLGLVNWWFIVPPNPFYPDPANPSQPDPNYACVHFGSVNRYDSAGPGFTHDRAYLVVGNLDQVKQGLAQVHSQFTALDPEVFNWREYVAINGLGFLTTPEAAQDHWLHQGLGQGLRGSRSFSAAQYLQLNPDLANSIGDSLAAIAHFVNTGRAEGRSTAVRPSAGMQHLILLENGKATSSGQNTFAQLGNGNTSPSGPGKVAFSPRLTEVVSGDYASLGVKDDGTVWTWGSNQYGIRGDGATGGALSTPVMVPGLKASTPSRVGKHALAVGTAFYAVIDPEGQVWTWGSNWNGRLGDGTTVDHYVPARVKKSANPNDYLTGIVSISAGGGTIAAVDADGAVWTWGAGANGSLGNGFTADSSYPVQVLQAGNNNTAVPLLGISQVACGSSGFCIALARYGQVFGWGANDFSQMGVAPGGALSLATPIGTGPGGIDLIAAGAAHCIAHSAADGKVYGWGYNGYGQLGAGYASVAQYPAVTMSAGPDAMNDIGDLAASSNFSMMVRYTDGAVFVSGDNQSGQLNISGSPLVQYLPVKSSLVAAP